MQGENRKPDFKGHWNDPTGPVEFSYFDFFIESTIDNIHGKLIAGYITDVFGDAVFSGYMDSRKITFTKMYSEQTRMNTGAAQCEIFYEGSIRGSEFSGRFRLVCGEDGVGHGGTFEMHPA